MNNSLVHFPVVNGVASTKMPTEELMDVLEYSLPPSWRREMTGQDFHPTDTGMKPFVNFCSRIEATESIQLEDKPTSSRCRHDAKRERSKRPRELSTSKQEYYCEIHGSNLSQDTVDCKARKKRLLRSSS